MIILLVITCLLLKKYYNFFIFPTELTFVNALQKLTKTIWVNQICIWNIDQSKHRPHSWDGRQMD